MERPRTYTHALYLQLERLAVQREFLPDGVPRHAADLTQHIEDCAHALARARAVRRELQDATAVAYSQIHDLEKVLRELVGPTVVASPSPSERGDLEQQPPGYPLRQRLAALRNRLVDRYADTITPADAGDQVEQDMRRLALEAIDSEFAAVFPAVLGGTDV